MSSTKPVATRRAISRWGVIITALAVLAAGCSQSENGASDGAEPATSISQTSLSSVSPMSPAGENTATSTSLSALDTNTTQASVEEEPYGSGSEIATTTTSLSPAEAGEPLPDEAVVESALSDEAIRLIGVGVDACADLYEFRCGRVLWDACAVLLEDFKIISEKEASVSADRVDEVNVTKEVVRYVKDKVCEFMDLAFFSELSAVLSARYGEDYFRDDRGFFIYRDQFAIASGLYRYSELSDEEYAEIFDVLPEGFGTLTEWGKNYIPDVVRPKLGQLFLYLRSHAISEDRLNLKSEDIVNNILAKQKAIEAIEHCNKVYLSETWLSEETNTTDNNNFNQCISELCDQESSINAIGCHPGGNTIEISEYNHLFENLEENAKVMNDINFLKDVLLWQVMKYVCAVGETHGNSDDDCRRVAFNICEYLKTEEFSIPITMTYVISPACILGTEFKRSSYTAAVNSCFDQLETFLTTKSLLFSPTNYCNEASNECIKFYSDRRSSYCQNYDDYFSSEILWKNTPLICAGKDTPVLSFGDSNCYIALEQFCRQAFISGNVSGIYSLYNSPFDASIGPFRNGSTIRKALCSYLFYPYEQGTTYNSIRSNNLIYTPQASTKIQIFRATPETIRGEFPSVSIEPINTATTECSEDQDPKNECIEKLWQSCFSILPTDPYINRKLAYYVCKAAWIAELARMASVLLSSFPEDYQAGSFNQFLQYMADEAVDRGEGILTIDESDTASPNLNREGLSPEVAESLTALGTSIAQLVQPYLSLPATNQQIVT